MSPPIRYQADKICISRASCRLRVFSEFPFSCFFVLVGSKQSDEQSSRTKIAPRSFAIVQIPSHIVMTYISGCSRPKPMTCLQSYLKPEKIMLIVKLGNSKMQAVNGVSMGNCDCDRWPKEPAEVAVVKPLTIVISNTL